MMAKSVYKIYTSGVLNKDKFIISEVSQKGAEVSDTGYKPIT